MPPTARFNPWPPAATNPDELGIQRSVLRIRSSSKGDVSDMPHQCGATDDSRAGTTNQSSSVR
eukprot:11812112-Alexandrium_andersonii.AAC.1